MKRNQFVAAASFAGATVFAGASAEAFAPTDVPGGRDLVEPHSAFDAKGFDAKLGRKAEIRQLWQNLAFKPSVFNNMKNSLNGLQFGFGYEQSSLLLVAANHGPSSAYTYTDQIWAKYGIGEFFELKDKSGAAISTNVFYPPKNSASGPTDPNDPTSVFQDASIAALQSRGVIFLTCHTAVQEQARALVKAGHAAPGMASADVAADILTNLIPGALVVPSMVATIAVMQHRFDYNYITVQS